MSALALAGCTAPPAEATEPNPADPATYSASYSADEFFIAGVKIGWQGALPSNTELVEAGRDYCHRVTAGDDSNSRRIASYAKAVYCP